MLTFTRNHQAIADLKDISRYTQELWVREQLEAGTVRRCFLYLNRPRSSLVKSVSAILALIVGTAKLILPSVAVMEPRPQGTPAAFWNENIT